MRIILGSSSPRRKDILSALIGDFEIMKPEIDESVLDGENAHAYCVRVAEEKRAALINECGGSDVSAGESVLLITCDTTVALEDHILGKPSDIADAARMLSMLQGRSHQVLSGIALFARVNGREIFASGIESTDVVFRKLSPRGIDEYLSRVHVLDKAGAYAAQEHGRLIIERIDGSMTNVIGLPLRLLFSLMSDHAILRFLL
jgi:septum formation protein